VEFLMKMSVALLSGNDKPVILYDGISYQSSEESDFIQILSGALPIPVESSISVNAAITLSNNGCSLTVEQNKENILNLSFGINYPPSVHLKLNSGQYIYISLDVDDV